MQNANYNVITELNNTIHLLKNSLSNYLHQLFSTGEQSVSEAYKAYLIDTLKKAPEQVISDACADLQKLISTIEVYENLEKYIKAKNSYGSAVEAICLLVKELSGETLLPPERFESNKAEINEASVLLAKSGITTDWLVSHGLATEQETVKIQQSKNVTGIKYKKIKKGIKIDSVDLSGGIIISEFIEGLPVVKIAERAFYKRKDITSVILPRHLNEIGDEAFSESGIVSISIPDSVEKIGDRAFYNCRQVENIILPEGLKSIKYKTFGGCSLLTQIRIPSNVGTIGNSAFERCRKLKKVQIPDSVTRFGYWVFDSKPTIYCNENTRASRFVTENYLPPRKPYALFEKEK